MARLSLFTVFRAVPGVLDFDVVRQVRATDLHAAQAEALRTLPHPIVCHARSGTLPAVDFSEIPAPRRTRRHQHVAA